MSRQEAAQSAKISKRILEAGSGTVTKVANSCFLSSQGAVALLEALLALELEVLGASEQLTNSGAPVRNL